MIAPPAPPPFLHEVETHLSVPGGSVRATAVAGEYISLGQMVKVGPDGRVYACTFDDPYAIGSVVRSKHTIQEQR